MEPVYFPDDSSGKDERANSTNAFYVDGDKSKSANSLIFTNTYTNAINGTTASSTAQRPRSGVPDHADNRLGCVKVRQVNFS